MADTCKGIPGRYIWKAQHSGHNESWKIKENLAFCRLFRLTLKLSAISVAFLSGLCVESQKKSRGGPVASTRETRRLVSKRIRPQLELHGLARRALAALEVPGRAGRVR